MTFAAGWFGQFSNSFAAQAELVLRDGDRCQSRARASAEGRKQEGVFE